MNRVYNAKKTHGYYFLRVTCEGRTTEVREPRFENSCCLVFAAYPATTIWAIRTRKVRREKQYQTMVLYTQECKVKHRKKVNLSARNEK
jgi:hypothetical protein